MERLAKKPGAERWMDAAMGWILSVGLHVVALLGCAPVIIEELVSYDSTYGSGLTCGLRGQLAVIDRVDLPRDVFERKVVTADEALPSLEFGSFAEIPAGSPAELRSASESIAGLPDRCLFGETPPLRSREGPQPLHRRAASEGGTIPPGSPYKYPQKYPNCNICDLESTTLASLRWLARHQNPSGSWSAAGFGRCCNGASCSGAGEQEFDEGVTALALLAFNGAGYSHLSKDTMADPAVPDRVLRFGEVVKKGLQWLIARQDAESCVGGRGPKFMYNHAIATLALSEAYGMTASEIFCLPAQKAVDFLVTAQNPGKGWRYGVREGGNDTSVTGWAVMALKSAELSSLAFPRTAYDGARAWLDQASESGPLPRVGYNQAGSGKVYIPGRNEQFADHPTMSAIAVLSRIFIQKHKRQVPLAATLVADLPAWEAGKVDFYYWYYASLALFQIDGPTGPLWKKWNEPMMDALIKNQKLAKSGCENGSWDPAADRWGSEGGRVYAVAINSLTLEIYYRFANVFGGSTLQR